MEDMCTYGECVAYDALEKGMQKDEKKGDTTIHSQFNGFHGNQW